MHNTVIYTRDPFYGYIFCVEGVGNKCSHLIEICMNFGLSWLIVISNDPFYVAVWLRLDLLFISLIFYALTEGTPFAGGIFRMRLVLGKDFPAVPPKGYFLTKIFHPNVGHKGEICVNVLKRDWKAELGLRHVLLVRCPPPCSYTKYLTLLPRLSLQLISFIPPADNQVSSHPSQPRVRPQRGGRAVTVRGLCRIRVSSSTAHGDPRHGWSRRNLRGTSGPKRRAATKEARRWPHQESGAQCSGRARRSG